MVFDVVPRWFSRLTMIGLNQTPHYQLPPMPWGIDRGQVEPTLRSWHPDLASVTEAAAGAAKNMPGDFRVSITNAPGAGAYPISTFTWLLIPSKINDPAKKKAITEFLTWMLKDGQSMTGALSYAPLPASVVAKETQQIAQIQ